VAFTGVRFPGLPFPEQPENLESEEKDDRIRGREEKMKETGRIKLKEIPFSRTFETGNGEELCNATGYAVQFDNEKTPLGFPLFWNEFQDREGNLYYGN
jgi:hypothetical protein